MSEQIMELFLLAPLMVVSVVLGWFATLPPVMEYLSWKIHRGLYPVWSRYWFAVAVIVPPFVGMFSDTEGAGERYAPCLSPEHRLSVMVLIACSFAAFIYSLYRKRLAPPLMEVLINCLLLSGIVVAIALMLQGGEWIEGMVMCLPFVLQSMLLMADNHRMVIERLGEEEDDADSRWAGFCRRIILLPAWKKFPLFLLLCIPVVCLVSAVLLLFGQKPDSVIRAFTDAYKGDYFRVFGHGREPDLGAHYLCSVAAKGHPRLVRPIRMGERGGKPIKCNRQLLVSNAFEELLEQRLPGLHRPVRLLYNKIGAGIHRYYGVFDHAWVSDLIYILMKPLEWGFVAVLYLSDRRPEDRIARQYLRKEDAAKCVEEWGMRWVGMRGTII
ncbi:MAG TPA: DUF6688 family protein [Puia sp.]|jgi:hypothetical protein|nr:DUF6688 family protein [Puia sp.]